MFYTGIGSRETPLEVQQMFIKLAKFLARKNFVLRSGHAQGSDFAFEVGCDEENGRKEIYIPWKGFEGSESKLVVSNRQAFTLASEFHPNWGDLTEGAKKLHARNTHQILGKDLESPSQFVICWTRKGNRQGGTGQALRMAEHYKIPILDVGVYSSIKEMRIATKKFLLKYTSLTEQDFKNS